MRGEEGSGQRHPLAQRSALEADRLAEPELIDAGEPDIIYFGKRFVIDWNAALIVCDVAEK
jgi:hypothetical protein